MREVYLVRHGKAAAAANGGDAARPLTDEGRAAIANAARGLRAFGVAPDAIWHSPFLRAEETAGILRGVLAAGVKTKSDDGFTPVASAERAAQAICEADARTLVVVSHMPLLPELCRALVGARVDFGTGTVAHVAVLGPHGSALLGLWTAELLSLVG